MGNAFLTTEDAVVRMNRKIEILSEQQLILFHFFMLLLVVDLLYKPISYTTGGALFIGVSVFITYFVRHFLSEHLRNPG